MRTASLERRIGVTIPVGLHRVSTNVGGFLESDEAEVDLAAGEAVHLISGIMPMVRNRFFLFFELKMMLIASPAAIAAFDFPPVMRFIERPFAAGFLAIVFLIQLGFLMRLPRLFSR